MRTLEVRILNEDTGWGPWIGMLDIALRVRTLRVRNPEVRILDEDTGWGHWIEMLDIVRTLRVRTPEVRILEGQAQDYWLIRMLAR